MTGKSAIGLDLPDNVHIHPAFHVQHIMPGSTQPNDIANKPPAPSRPFIYENAELVRYVHKIPFQNEKGRLLQSLTQYKNGSVGVNLDKVR